MLKKLDEENRFQFWSKVNICFLLSLPVIEISLICNDLLCDEEA